MSLPSRVVRRRVTSEPGDIFRYERALQRTGFPIIAGLDEAGRGACAGPLVVAAVILAGRGAAMPRIEELADSKMLSGPARNRVFDRVLAQAAQCSVVVIEPAEIDRIGLHVANIEGMRRALARLEGEVDYVLSDGFAVPGTSAPNLGVWKGDQVLASVAAAGVIAKVTRDRIMGDLDRQWPGYGFAVHKGYVTPGHRKALAALGPIAVHRFCFEPVRLAARAPNSASGSGSGHDVALIERSDTERRVRHEC